MAFTVPPLPFAMDALEPYMSSKTLSYHYGKHNKAYNDTLNNLIKGTDYETMPLEEIIRTTQSGPIFNNAAQAWNHSFFWHSMSPNGGGQPKGELLKKIERDFGSYEQFRAEFKNAALGQFGSGWAWLVEEDGKLKVMKTANAATPIAEKLKPLIAIDVWEHAYYLDYQNRRGDFIEAFLDHLVKWK